MPKNTSKRSSDSGSFYVSVDQHKGKIHVVEYSSGERKYFSTSFSPTLYIIGKEDDPKCVYRSVVGEPMKEKSFKSIYDYNDFISDVKERNLSSLVGGTISPVFQFISEVYEELNPDYRKIVTCFLDIETGPGRDGGFPDMALADGEILSICIKYSDVNKFVVFGTGEYKKNREDVIYVKCKNEAHLLQSFLNVWKKKYPDVISGWFISTFDMPYLFTRISNILGENAALQLSPFNVAYLRDDLDPIRKNIIEDRKVLFIAGIQELDYIRLYKKFGARSETESNALNYIAELELGEKKIEYNGSIFNLYKTDYDKFIDYNIHDVYLVEKLDQKIQLLYLAFSLAYYSRVNFRDVFFQVRMWDAIIYNFLKKKNVVIPFSTNSGTIQSGSYTGAYVKEPQVGMKDWVVSFDVTSLYPHLIIQFNISPDTIRKDLLSQVDLSLSIDDLLERRIPESMQALLKKENCCMAGNKTLYTNEKQGFLAELMITLFQERKKYKKISLENKKKYEETKDEAYLYEYKKYDILQNVKKICLNSAYGALGNTFFRFYDVYLAEAVTYSGQLVIRWVERACNEFLNQYFNTDNVDYCLASDTDSVYLDLSRLKGKAKTADDVDAMIKNRLLSYVDGKLNELKDMLNCIENKIELKREVIADRGIFIAKKRYCLNVLDSEGVKYNPPKLKMMGVEAIKSSTPKICRELLQEAIRIILQEDQHSLFDFYKKIREEFKSYSVDDIAFPRGINGMEKYSFNSKSIPIHVYGALVFNRLIREKNLQLEAIRSGDKIKFFYLKEPNWLNSHVLSYPSNRQFPKELSDIIEMVDYDKMIEKAFSEPLKIVLDKISWSLIERSTLIDLFA